MALIRTIDMPQSRQMVRPRRGGRRTGWLDSGATDTDCDSGIDCDSGTDRLLAQARAGLSRLAPSAVERVEAVGGLIVDIRPEAQRRQDGEFPSAR